MATLADVYKPYIKPSMKGRIILRKRTVNRKSEAVKKVNEIFAQAKLASRCKGRPWEKFVSCLREEARKEGLKGLRV